MSVLELPDLLLRDLLSGVLARLTSLNGVLARLTFLNGVLARLTSLIGVLARGNSGETGLSTGGVLLIEKLLSFAGDNLGAPEKILSNSALVIPPLALIGLNGLGGIDSPEGPAPSSNKFTGLREIGTFGEEGLTLIKDLAGRRAGGSLGLRLGVGDVLLSTGTKPVGIDIRRPTFGLTASLDVLPADLVLIVRGEGGFTNRLFVIAFTVLTNFFGTDVVPYLTGTLTRRL